MPRKQLIQCVIALSVASVLAAQGQEPPAREQSGAEPPYPEITPFDSDPDKREAYLDYFYFGYRWAQGSHFKCPPSALGTNLYIVRGWIDGWKSGIRAGGKSDLPANYAPYVTWDKTSDHFAPSLGLQTGQNASTLSDDMSSADLEVRVDRDDKLDIGIEASDDDERTFRLSELKTYFEAQRHKDFIVVRYDKNAPHEDLQSSLARLKRYFAEAGYKRILLIHSHSRGVVVHEDFRPDVPSATKR